MYMLWFSTEMGDDVDRFNAGGGRVKHDVDDRHRVINKQDGEQCLQRTDVLFTHGLPQRYHFR